MRSHDFGIRVTSSPVGMKLMLRVTSAPVETMFMGGKMCNSVAHFLRWWWWLLAQWARSGRDNTSVPLGQKLINERKWSSSDTPLILAHWAKIKWAKNIADLIDNFWPTGPKVALKGTEHHYGTSAPVEPKFREKEISRIRFDYGTKFDK